MNRWIDLSGIMLLTGASTGSATGQTPEHVPNRITPSLEEQQERENRRMLVVYISYRHTRELIISISGTKAEERFQCEFGWMVKAFVLYSGISGLLP